MLNAITVKVRLLVCDFCGTVHGKLDEAKQNGCDKEPGDPLYKVGDTVLAGFTVGAGMEAVGKHIGNGKVVSVSKPKTRTVEDGQDVEYSRQSGSMLIPAVNRRHEWVYHVEPLKETVESFEERYEGRILLGGSFGESRIGPPQ